MKFQFHTTVGKREAEVLVTYSMTAPVAATYWQPAEGGEVEIDRIEDATTGKAVFLSQDEEDKIHEEASDRAMQDWSERLNDEADYRYEQYRDRMMEQRL